MPAPDNDDVILWKSLMIAATISLLFYIFVLIYTSRI